MLLASPGAQCLCSQSVEGENANIDRTYVRFPMQAKRKKSMLIPSVDFLL